MKKSVFTLIAVTAMLFSWHSCTQTEEIGTLQFGMELSDDSALKSAVTDRGVTEALISIVGVNGEVIFDKEPLQLIAFGDQYVTRKLEIPVGEYQLTEFMLVDSSGIVLWATPVQGSKLAHLVRNPLPFAFGISPDETTSLEIEVVRVGNHPPADFGYLNFNIHFVDRFCLKVFYSSRCPEYWYDSVAGPDGTVMPPFYQSRFTISVGDRIVVNEPLVPGLNYYRVPKIAEWYRLSATGCTGDLIFEKKLPLKELMNHRCQPDFKPLMIYPDADTGIIITPEGLYEPTIKQGVFGSITLPTDNFDEAGNSDNWPVIRDIYFFPYMMWDSIYTFAPVDCYFPPEFINMKPVAIVRTNSDGYFQVPLRQGEYLYLVKHGEMFYIDAYISSRLPGKVMVYPGEITKLMIAIVDCSMWQ